MAVLLRVERPRAVTLDLVLPEISRALRGILGLDYEPELIATKMYDFEEPLPCSTNVRAGSTSLAIKVKTENAAVSVFSREGADYITISPDCWRTKVESALAAAVAVALADYSGSEISESGLTYSSSFRQTARQFLQSVRVSERFDSINEAAEAFFAGLASVKRRD
jgi:hypothetical protein